MNLWVAGIKNTITMGGFKKKGLRPDVIFLCIHNLMRNLSIKIYVVDLLSVRIASIILYFITFHSDKRIFLQKEKNTI